MTQDDHVRVKANPYLRARRERREHRLMNPGAHRKVLAIVNPVSGQHHPDGTCKLIEEAAAQQQIDLEIRLTEGDGDALRWAQAASAEGFDLLLVSGGDGTVMEALSGQLKGGGTIPLAQLPTGTANLIARALAIPTDRRQALEVAFSGPTVKLDVGYLPDHDRYFTLIAGAGWDARLIEDTTRGLKRRIGFAAYVLTGVKNLFNLRRTLVEVTLDGEKKEYLAHTVMIANIGRIERANLALGPGISPHDGKLDLVIVTSANMFGMIALAFRIVTRQVGRHPGTIYAQVKRASIRARRPLPVQIDGEPLGETPLAAEVVPAAARVVVPAAYAEALTLPRVAASTGSASNRSTPPR